MEAFELLGQWWIPQEQSQVVAGTLTFSHQDGIRLVLMGTLKPLPQDLQEFQKSKTYPLVVGTTQEGKAISLSECTVINSQIGFGGVNYANQSFMVQSAYVGIHFSDPQEIRFHKIIAQYSHLHHWTSFSSIQPKVVPDDKGGMKRYEITYNPPDEIVATTSKGTITVTSSFHSQNSLQEASLRQSVWIEIAVETPLPVLEWLQQFVGPLQNLLTLGTCKPNFLLDLKGYRHEYNRTLSNGKVEEISIQIIYHQIYYTSQIDKNLHPHDMLFMLQDIKDGFSHYIENWFQIQQDLDSVCNLFFGIQYLSTIKEQIWDKTC
jgi:ApeA N-terminal domain 1